jgi:hypothetical protein
MHVTAAAMIGACVVTASFAGANATSMQGGEWAVSMKMGADDAQPIVRKICYTSDMPVNDKFISAQLQGAMQKMNAACDKPDIQISGSTVTTALVCKVQQMTISTKSKMTFDGDSAYHQDSQTHVDNPMAGMPAEMAMSQDGKRLGPCQPGDKQMPDLSK